MNARATTLILALVTGGPALAADDGQAALAPIRAFIAALNRHDAPGMEAVHTASPVIIDELAPHLWQGSDALRVWLRDDDADIARNGLRNPQVILAEKPSYVTAEPDHAYAVFPARYDYGLPDGKQGEVRATFTFSLVRTSGAWKIAGWAWGHLETR